MYCRGLIQKFVSFELEVSVFRNYNIISFLTVHSAGMWYMHTAVNVSFESEVDSIEGSNSTISSSMSSGVFSVLCDRTV